MSEGKFRQAPPPGMEDRRLHRQISNGGGVGGSNRIISESHGCDAEGEWILVQWFAKIEDASNNNSLHSKAAVNSFAAGRWHVRCPDRDSWFTKEEKTVIKSVMNERGWTQSRRCPDFYSEHGCHCNTMHHIVNKKGCAASHAGAMNPRGGYGGYSYGGGAGYKGGQKDKNSYECVNVPDRSLRDNGGKGKGRGGGGPNGTASSGGASTRSGYEHGSRNSTSEAAKLSDEQDLCRQLDKLLEQKNQSKDQEQGSSSDLPETIVSSLLSSALQNPVFANNLVGALRKGLPLETENHITPFTE